jgi:hypothetical protein
MALACKICIATVGLRGSEIASLPQNEEELAQHMESVHHCPVQREGETMEEAKNRFIKTYPNAKDCPDCKAANAPWAREGYEDTRSD